jgi:deferrochelatase/peroxidase EfeB
MARKPGQSPPTADVPHETGDRTETGATGNQSTAGVSRRALLTGGAILGGGLLVGAGAGAAAAAAVAAHNATGLSEPFWGAHQGGITTDTQRHAVLAAFDMNTARKSDLVDLLKAWTALGAELAAGTSATIPVYAGTGQDAYSDTTGSVTTDDSLEAWQLGPERLTLTVGFGPGLFTKDGKDRYGLAGKRPAQLVELPRFVGDELDASQSDGDLFLQACADDPQVAFHAVRSIARIAPDVATLRWTQVGFSPANTGGTPRNLMGFKDGTMNSNVHPPANLNTTVWAGSESPAWMQGGSYLVYRRIRITLEHWDRLNPSLQEQVVGRSKLSGAPLGQHTEFDTLDLDKMTSDGTAAIPVNAHVRLAAPQTNDGAVILRRAFSYNNGTTPFVERWPPWRQALEYDSGLLFLAYQSDPRTGFIRINKRLSESDAMNQFTTHTASGTYAIPPGPTGPGDWIGRTLLT